MTATDTTEKDQDSGVRLTKKQRVFIDSYLSNGFNATDAARQAGYRGNDNVLGVTGYRVLRNASVAAQVTARLNEHAMSANECMAIISTHARGSLADVLNSEGEWDLEDAKRRGTDKLLKKLKVRRTVRSTKEGETIEDITHEFEIHDPQNAAITIAKHHKLLTDRKEIGGLGGGPLKIEVEFFDEPAAESGTDV